MALDTVPASSQSDGRHKIAYVATLATNSVVTIKAGKALTYSFTPDGFNWSITQAEVTDSRYTLVQDLTRPGKKKETLEVKYVASADANGAQTVLVEGTTGKLVVRRGVDNATDWTVADKVDIITFVAGAQRPDAPVENGVDTISQTLFITDVTVRGATLVA
jgi:hypothetical protein